jgi:hypothetical protein
MPLSARQIWVSISDCLCRVERQTPKKSKSSELLDQASDEITSLLYLARVIQMVFGDNERTVAYQIAIITEDESLGRVEVGHLVVVLILLRVAKGDGGGNLAQDGLVVNALGGAVDHGGALAVAREHNLRVGAGGRDVGNEVGHVGRVFGVGAAGNEVLG